MTVTVDWTTARHSVVADPMEGAMTDGDEQGRDPSVRRSTVRSGGCSRMGTRRTGPRVFPEWKRTRHIRTVDHSQARDGSVREPGERQGEAVCSDNRGRRRVQAIRGRRCVRTGEEERHGAEQSVRSGTAPVGSDRRPDDI